MSRWTLTAALSLLALGAAFAAQQLLPAASPDAPPVATAEPDPAPDVAPAEPRDVDIVLCLDTSGSMTALIDSARARLWDVVNQIAEVEPNANLRVGLLSYGSPMPDGEAKGWVVLQTPLTDDLDALYDTMWGLSTEGGEEYVGWVIGDALEQMPWSTDDNAAHLIFVAGNESALQGPKDALTIAGQARERGFRVNTLYAGDSARGAHEQWDEVAQAGGGRFTAISMTDGLAQVATPHDDEIQRLNDALNQTYVPYGAEGRLKQERQVKQDANARSMGLGSATTRALAKGTRMYKNSGWDLVDAVEDGADLEAIPEAALPAELQAMEPDARKAYVDQQAQEREAIREKLKQAKRSRDAWLDENAEQGEGLGAKMKEMVAEQL